MNDRIAGTKRAGTVKLSRMNMDDQRRIGQFFRAHTRLHRQPIMGMDGVNIRDSIFNQPLNKSDISPLDAAYRLKVTEIYFIQIAFS